MQIEHCGRSVRVGVETSVPAARNWLCLADPGHLAKWYSDGASGEPKTGATYTWRWDTFPDQAMTVLALEPGRSIVLESTFGRIEFRVSDTAGGSRVDLIHSGLPHGEEGTEIAAGCESGWQMALALLKLYGENYWEQEKRTVFVAQPAQFEYADAFAWFSTKEKAGKWLQTFAKVNEPLALTGQEACWRWDAVGGALEMKAFGSCAENRQLALRAVSWSRGYDLETVRGDLENSLDHLRKLLIP